MDENAHVSIPALSLMKRVVFIIPHMGIGGTERSLISLLNCMPPGVFDITVITFVPGGDLLSELPPHVTVICDKEFEKKERIRALMSRNAKTLMKGKLFSFMKSGYHKFGRVLLARKKTSEAKTYEIAIAYADGLATWYTANRISAKHKIAFVHTDFSLAQYDSSTENKVYCAFSEIFFDSVAARQRFLSVLPQFESKSLVLPNIIDAEKVRRLACQEQPQFCKDGKISILTVGRLSHEKGVLKIPTVLQMLQAHGEHVIWYIIGDGPERKRIQDLSIKLHVEDMIAFLGLKSNPYPYMKNCDIYVQPSDYEGYCISLAEARILAKPIVTCRFAGAEEQICNGKNGFVTDMQAKDIFESISRLIHDENLRTAFSKQLADDWEICGKKAATAWWQDLSNMG